MATVEGKVDVVRVCERRGEDEVLGAGTVDSGATDWEQSKQSYMWELMVSLFIRCTMRCEIWAQPAELSW